MDSDKSTTVVLLQLYLFVFFFSKSLFFPGRFALRIHVNRGGHVAENYMTVIPYLFCHFNVFHLKLTKTCKLGKHWT